MKKEFYFNLDQAQCDWAFKAIRSKVDVVEILMRVLKTISIYVEPSPEEVVGKIKLHIGKMSRLFFFKDDKYYSMSFPFFVENREGQFFFSSIDIDDIDSYITSKVISIINDPKFQNASSWAFIEPFLEMDEQNTVPGFWSFFKMLLTYEDGYIRYDVDAVREDGDKHPLYHFDVFYSSSPTFKIGLRKHFTNDLMIDFLDISTDCHFLK
ncbi:MAG: hypothetical protein FT726_20990 [Pantoea sp. Morm]|uniref:hypothetical protein n=1 Tax=Pantoea sp. Morm TaxID=2601250 RepID=UPI001D21CFC1|nr:hypothetical protein [Pantoea sp. Morm]